MATNDEKYWVAFMLRLNAAEHTLEMGVLPVAKAVLPSSASNLG